MQDFQMKTVGSQSDVRTSTDHLFSEQIEKRAAVKDFKSFKEEWDKFNPVDDDFVKAHKPV